LRPLVDRRREEQSKYEYLLTAAPRYGSKNHGEGAVQLVRAMKPVSVLDVGCGDNDFIKHMPNGVWSLGVDLVNPRANIVAPAHDLPFYHRI
jgi:hypothetical protein